MHRTKSMRTAIVFLFAALATIVPASAKSQTVRPEMSVSSLAGPWQATLFITGGCGVGTKLVTFTLNSGGLALATETFHTDTCGDNTETGTFRITSLNSTGTGTAQLIVDQVVFNFSIQVAASGDIFNMVDVTDYGNYEEGSAIHQ